MSSPTPEAVALHRYGLLTKIQDLLHQRLPLSLALERVAAASIPGPDGLEATVAKRTLEDWWYAYKKGGFAALHPKSRSDRGRPRALTEAQQRFVLDQVRTHLAVPIKVLYRQWKQSDPSLPGLTCIYRWLERHDLHHKARRYQLRQAVSGPTKSFEMPAVNDLWMVDFSPGPFLTVPGRTKALATHLCALLDDLNARLADWLQSTYHARVHSGTEQTPHQRFHQAAHLIRSLDPSLDLDRLFHTELERVVRKDGTVRLGNQLYEVDLALRGLCVRLRFDPWTRASVEVEYRGQSFGLARLVDPHLNSQLGSSSHYEKP